MATLPTTNAIVDYSEWYNEIVKKADLAEHSPVRGCMIIKPYGYALWENIQAKLDQRFKETGHQNAYFPLLIPKSFLSREAAHVEGFAKECAVVTHYRLKNNPNGEGVVVDPEAKLEEELIIRPTSETIIWNTYKDWIKSYRDLPLLINQWANVMRWEMRTRPFLRTSEFLWQEGHTAHATKQEAIEEAKKMNEVYAHFVENEMAIPVIRGFKSPSERFAGAEDTYCIEALMRDGKALQAGTSHFLGQNFSRSFGVQFLNKNNEQEFVWATSWGVSTRLIGALIMAHGDAKGIKMPPRIAPIQVVIVPIYKGGESVATLNGHAEHLASSLKKAGIRVKVDTDENARPGWKYAEYEMKGVPIRLSFGLRDMEEHTLELVRRDNGGKQVISSANAEQVIPTLLEDIQRSMFASAASFTKEHTTDVHSRDEFKQVIEVDKGFVRAFWDGTSETEEQIKEQTKATIRCIPLERKEPSDKDVCVWSGKPAKYQVLFAVAY